MRVIVDSPQVHSKTGTSANGRDYAFHWQDAYLDQGKRYPTEFKLRLANEKQPWAPGEYTINFDASVYVDKFNSAQLSDVLDLVPFPAE